MTRAVLTITCLFLLGTSAAIADDTLWTARYNGQASRDDFGRFVLVDQQDNAIVVGSSIGNGTGKDIVVVKYASDGTRQWDVTIQGAGNSSDDPKGAALDPSGNIYVAAQTGVFPDYNIMVVKIAPDDSVLWRRVWAGEDDKADVPAGIAVDANGNSYVTGYTTTANGLTDFVTMKLLTDSGSFDWTVVRQGEGGGKDYGMAIALGPTGNVYVTGYSARQYMDDFCTVMYNPSGAEQWAKFYNYSGNATDQATAIAVDPSGNAYVTGRSATAPAPAGVDQYATIKYSASGAEAWVKRYAGSGASVPAAIALGDAAVYVTGSSQGSAGDDDYATIGYDFGGNQVWVNRFNGPPAKADNAADVAVLPSGAVLVTGTSMDFDNRGDFYTMRYSATGAEEWAIRYNGIYNGDEQASAIVFDSHWDVYVFGSSYGAGNYDFMLVKYDSIAGGAIAEPGRTSPGRSAMRLTPNPAHGWTSLECPFAGTGPASVSVLGVDGRAVSTRQLDLRAEGSARLDLAGVVPGVYVVRLEAGAYTATRKLIVGR